MSCPATPGNDAMGLVSTTPQPPVLHVNSGDNDHFRDDDALAQSGRAPAPRSIRSRSCEPTTLDVAPHTLTGPVFVEGGGAGATFSRCASTRSCRRALRDKLQCPRHVRRIFRTNFPMARSNTSISISGRMTAEFAPGIEISAGAVPGHDSGLGAPRPNPDSTARCPPGNLMPATWTFGI